MPRAVKPKAASAGAAAAAKKPSAGAKKNKLYAMPEKIREGTVLTDLAKGQWCVGPSIGTGGFGEIYSACKVGEKNYDYVVKCEPHGNGPLFVEMHFYMRNARRDDIEKFKRENGLKSLGMPYMLGNGSADINGQKHRFIVMPRYDCDVDKHYKANGERLPEATCYRLAIQMLDVYEFVHSCGYVHADLKGANILLGLGKGGAAQAYLVDYGLASHFTTKDFKPDPKKMHNGTIEYTSRDAHQGVATMRADLEILGYNLIQWLGVQLPWVRDKQLVPPTKAQIAKEAFMKNVETELKKLFPKGAPAAIVDFMKYVAKMTYNETPNYDKCRNIFLSALKQMKISNSGDLDFKLKSTSNNNNYVETATTSKAAPIRKPRANIVQAERSDSDSDEVICASDDDEDDVVFEQTRRKTPKITPRRQLNTVTTKAKSKVKSPLKASPKLQNLRRVAKSPQAATSATPSPRKRNSSPMAKSTSPENKKQRTHATPLGERSASSRLLRQSPSAKINISPAISMRSRSGKTIINDSLTPKPRSNKTYEFNFELDVSMDANVIVNVKRKKKAAADEQRKDTPSSSKSSRREANGESADTPVTRVKVRKVPSTEESTSTRSPRTPAVTLKKKYRD